MVLHHRLEQIYQHLYPSSSSTESIHNEFNNSMVVVDENGGSNLMMMNLTSGVSSSNHERVIYQKLDQYPIVVLYLNDGPVNALSAGFIKAIQSNIERANNDEKVKGIIIASKLKGFFVAGADITEIAKGQGKNVQTSDAQVQFLQNGNGLMNLIENSPKNKPTIACIDGVALGGGLELAMSCNGRVCTENSVLGLPETNLGIIPGFGGCNRLPRLIGTRKSIEMMLTAQPIKGKQAFELGLVDKLEKDSSRLLNSCIELVLEMINGKKSVKKSLLYSKVLLEEGNSIEIVNQIESKLDPIQQKLPHLRALIRVVRESVSYISNGYYGLDCEGKEFLKISNQPVSRGMVHYFLASKATTKLPKYLLNNTIGNTTTNTNTGNTTRIKYLGVIGSGTMGANIIVNALENGIQVILKEINENAVQAGLDRIRKVFQSKVDRKRMSKEQYDKVMSQVKGQITFENFDKLDMVIEAVLEIVELKQNIFADLEKHCSPNCILATNTSTIDLNRISDKMSNKKNRERVIGLHYFTPAHVMPLLEIIRTEHNTSNVLNASLAFAKQVKKTPVVVLNAVGFAVNRIFWPYGIAAQYLIERGVHPYQLDKAISQTAIRVGFFNMADMSGVDVLNYASGSIGGAYKDRARVSPLLKLMIDNKRLGEKTGLGFYKYDQTGKRSPDLEGMEVLLTQARKLAGNPSKLNYSDKEIVEACLFNAVNEACRVIEEKLVFRVSDIDVASVMGMGFMHFYGGLMKWADEYGAKYIHDQLNKFYQDSNGEIVSFKPCKYLTECAANNLSLYSADAQLMQ